jgi:hypothetical protein
MVEAALGDTGLFADFIDAHGIVITVPDQVQRGFQKDCAGVGGAHCSDSRTKTMGIMIPAGMFFNRPIPVVDRICA